MEYQQPSGRRSSRIGVPTLQSPFNIFDPQTWPDAFTIAPNGQVLRVRPANETDFTLEELQTHIGKGYIQQLSTELTDDFLMWCDEDGLRKDLLLNQEATMLYNYGREGLGGMMVAVVGQVLVTRRVLVK